MSTVQASSATTTPVKPSAGVAAVTPPTSFKFPNGNSVRLHASQDPATQAHLSDKILKFNVLLTSIPDCDLQRVRNAAAGAARSAGGLKIVEFKPLLQGFGIDVTGLESNRATANQKLTRLLQQLNLQ